MSLHIHKSAPWRVFGVALLVFLLGSPSAQSRAEQQSLRLQGTLVPPVLVAGEPVVRTKLLDRMAALRVPAVSIAVIHGGKIEWAEAFGVVRLGGPPATPDTLFQAASISKTVTALAIMRLTQDGKLDLDRNVNQYLKTWKVPENEFTRAGGVTLRELLSHSAGTTVSGFEGYEAGSTLPSLVQILDGKSPANNAPIRVDTTPGKLWRYSGGGYEVVEQVLTDVANTPFSQLMRDLVLQPLRMQHSAFERPLSSEKSDKAVTPYLADGRPVPGGSHVYPELGAAGLWTTPSDLARFAIGVQNSLKGAESSILSRASATMMLTPVIGRQAIGFSVGGSDAHPYFNHGGVNYGTRSFLVAYQEGDGAIIMTSGAGGDTLIPEILRTIASDYGWPDFAPPVRTAVRLPAKSFDPCMGAYWLASGRIATFWREGDRLYGRVWGSPVSELLPSSGSELFARSMDARARFTKDDSGRSSSMTLNYLGQEQTAECVTGNEARDAVELSKATERRFKNQKADANSASVLEAFIIQVRNGTPQYEQMDPAFAQIVRDQLPVLQSTFKNFGPVKSISFKGVKPEGGDTYNVEFASATREFDILLQQGERISGVVFTP
jgi:CubicO group peptidase (beta-lactamase class C family)